MLFDWLVIAQVVPMNPAAAVRGPKRTLSYAIFGEGSHEWRQLPLPLLNVYVGLRQPICLPCLPAAAVPIDIGVTECS
jgi:hypothetical protein